ncbi:hypothetical protein [Cecembia calidifontis]|jgi:hypothetical protein|uniref:Outer membrane protein with beta-barrel domain n=1 Tax=Cecembia calidifontis TaxID=1187080 RepID=A0A4V2F6I2_9BACT|nr:hypothetical protein [Cecembia calidifontis]RZS96409.1 hypothetical protein BC751_1980 [Cecembia calidifontis]
MRISNKISLLLILLFTCGVINQVSAQEKADVITAKNSIYAELGGNGFLYSINYSRIFNQKGAYKFSGSAGFSYVKQVTTTHWTPLIPIEASVLLGKTSHHLELGTGTSLFTAQSISLDNETNTLQENVSFNSLIFFRLGYRYQKPEGGFFFRIGYTPGFNLNLDVSPPPVFFPLWGGISLGKSF